MENTQKKSIVKMEPVIDCWDMPEDVRNAFFENSEQGNDCYITVYLDSAFHEDDWTENTIKVAKWCKEQMELAGIYVDVTSSVIVRHYW